MGLTSLWDGIVEGFDRHSLHDPGRVAANGLSGNSALVSLVFARVM
jgi:hypothetical protein